MGILDAPCAGARIETLRAQPHALLRNDAPCAGARIETDRDGKSTALMLMPPVRGRELKLGIG